MKWTQAMKMAFSAILSNKMRSFLTMLGIIIGVLSVSLLVSLVQGATDSVTAQFQELGGNKLMVSISGRDARSNFITAEDLKGIENKDGIEMIAPSHNGSGTAIFENNSSSVSIAGVTASYESVEAVKLSSGSFIKESDDENRLNVAVVGTQVAKDLFGHTAVIGNSFSMLGRSFQIIGVLEENGSTSYMSNDDIVYIPFSLASRLLKITGIYSFTVSTESVDSVDQARVAVEKFLDERIKTASVLDEDLEAYSILNMGDILSAVDQVMGTMTMLLGGIAGISLLVGGIGIMNIMLVSVTERTKEIGIRKAIGAKYGDIMSQFLIESMAISVTGGLIGLFFGALLLQLFSRLMDMPISLSPGVSALALLFSLGIGVIFGIYPANKAAKLKPIDALRYE